jgi:ATP phosphoribosyltransferase regulatory subunit
MAAESALAFDALEGQAAGLIELFKIAGYEPVAPSIIQPADIFLDQVGEQLRSRTYVFTDPDGEELCLRPDLTVPVARLYLERHPLADVAARYCYNGPAFRFQRGGDRARPREFRQAGIENIGDADALRAETEVVGLAVDGLRQAGLSDLTLRFGDIALFFEIVGALGLPDRWRDRLRHYFWRPNAFRDLLHVLEHGKGPSASDAAASLAQRLAGASTDDAESLTAAYLAERGIPLIGDRSLKEIAARLCDQAADLRADPLPDDAVRVIEDYLAVSGPPRAAAARIGDIASSAEIDLDGAIETHTRRFEALQKRGVKLNTCAFSAEFGRNLEYYSGLVFQIETGEGGAAGQIAGGGRYDGLLALAGGAGPVPAVGCAIHTERLLAAVRGSPS